MSLSKGSRHPCGPCCPPGTVSSVQTLTRLSAWLRLLVWALLLPAGTAGAEPFPEIGSGFDVISYDVALTPDFIGKSVSGIEAIRLTGTADGAQTLAFSPNALSITRATVDGRAVETRSDAQGIVFKLDRPLRKGHVATLRFAFSGTPRRGVSWSGESVYTSYFACDWMVCLQDSPADKADFALSLRLPQQLSSLSNGRMVKQALPSTGQAIHRWRSQRPYSPYLFAFAAGAMRVSRQQGGHGELVYKDLTGAEADLTQLFGETAGIAAFFASKAGVPLPNRRYTQLLVPGREAQEAATHSLIGAEELKRDLAQPERSWIIAHELAHQWWGNLVTCASWRDFWLHEGVATFMTAAWKEQRHGRAAYEAELASARQRVERAGAQGYDKPLVWSGQYPSLATRRAIHYAKGALFLDQLRGQLGEDQFWGGLRLFTRGHAGGVVTSVDFQRAMERASGRDLKPIFQEWVFGREESASR